MEVMKINGDIGVCIKDGRFDIEIGVTVNAHQWSHLTSIERDHVELLRDAINEYLEATK
jgi:hypothetical protein